MNKAPIRCFEGTAQPHEPFWIIKNSGQNGEAEIEINGYISEYSWFDDDITPKKFKDDLEKFGKGNPITIRMNSYGGDVIAASMMNAIIKDYPGKVTVQIDGVAASAATVVAVAGDQVRIQETAYFMIHDPLAIFMFASLNIEDVSRLTDTLKALKEGIVNAYETKTGLSRNRISNLMTEETWMDAQKALDLGFVDEIIRGESKKLVLPQNAAVVNALRDFSNVPEALKLASTPVQTQVDSPAAARLRAEVQIRSKKGKENV